MSTDPWAVVSLNPGLGLSRLNVLVSNIYTLAQVERELAVARQNQAFKPDSEDEQEEREQDVDVARLSARSDVDPGAMLMHFEEALKQERQRCRYHHHHAITIMLGHTGMILHSASQQA